MKAKVKSNFSPPPKNFNYKGLYPAPLHSVPWSHILCSSYQPQTAANLDLLDAGNEIHQAVCLSTFTAIPSCSYRAQQF